MNDNKIKSTGSVVKHSLRFEETSDDTRTIIPNQSIVFSNWFLFKKQIEQIGPENGKNVILQGAGRDL